MVHKFDGEEFEKAVRPAIEWLQKNGDPHYKIIIQQDYAELVSGELGFPVDPPD
ncbi:MAG: hypothetical protein LUD12_10390 [Lachnospiraceae bacterium]|nr:hypothetical protein [Lachnospiraceae bacterium]